MTAGGGKLGEGSGRERGRVEICGTVGGPLVRGEGFLFPPYCGGQCLKACCVACGDAFPLPWCI